MFASRYAAAAAAALLVPLAASAAHACRGGDCFDVRYREVIEGPPVAIVAPIPVIVAPGRVDTVRMPPETVTVVEDVVVQPAGYAWSRTGPNGERCCAVPVPAETKLVQREVIVRPSRTVTLVTPPEHRWRNRVVAVAPGFRTVTDTRSSVRRSGTRERIRVRVRRTTTFAARPLWYGW